MILLPRHDSRRAALACRRHRVRANGVDQPWLADVSYETAAMEGVAPLVER